MALVKSDGNGGLTIPKWFLGLLTLTVLVAGFGSGWGTAQQQVVDHLCNPEIHVTHSALKDEFASNADVRDLCETVREIDNRTREMQQTLVRIDQRTGGTP
jgi:hypothetical protein